MDVQKLKTISPVDRFVHHLEPARLFEADPPRLGLLDEIQQPDEDDSRLEQVARREYRLMQRSGDREAQEFRESSRARPEVERASATRQASEGVMAVQTSERS
ncbi:MAG TPA: hypothetical protein VIN06_05100 [Devosia sp.]